MTFAESVAERSSSVALLIAENENVAEAKMAVVGSDVRSRRAA
jgi:hypothetical protein